MMVGRRTLFWVAVFAVVALSSAESPTLGEDQGAEGDPAKSIPMDIVASMSMKMEDDNARLQAKNNALRTKQAVNKQKQRILIAGGLVKKKSVKKNTKVKKAKAAAKAIPDATNLQPIMAKGMAVIDSYAKTDHKLQSKVVKMQAQIDVMKQASLQTKANAKRKVAKAESKLKQALVPNKYQNIPYFKFSAASKTTKHVKSRRKCQETCDRQQKCKSYSWNQGAKTCMWSVDSVHFDPEFNFYTKGEVGTAGSHTHAWRTFAGLVWRTANLHEKNNFSPDECRMACARDVTCKSYSYKAKSHFCQYGSGELEYDGHFQFYSKEDTTAARRERALKAARKHVAATVKKMRERTKKKEQKMNGKLAREDKSKKAKKEIWLKNLPTRSQQRKMKGKIQLQVDSMQVALAAKRAKGKKAAEVAEKADMKRKLIKDLAKVKKLQKDMLLAKTKYKKAEKAAGPLLKKEVSTKARIQKAAMDGKLLDVDLAEHEKTAARAQATLTKANKDKDEKVMAAAKAALKKSAQNVQDTIKKSKERASKVRAYTRLSGEENQRSQTAKVKAEASKAFMKAKQATLDQILKGEKVKRRKAKLALETASDKSRRAKMLTAKSKERLTKVTLARAKVAHWQSDMELKHVQNDEERRKAQMKWSQTAAVLFHAKKKAQGIMNFMTRSAFKLANTNELLSKAKHKAKRSSSTKPKRDLALTVATLKGPH